MARIKPDPYMVLDLAQCEGALAEMASIDRKLSAIENEMREVVDGKLLKHVKKHNKLLKKQFKKQNIQHANN